MWGRWPRTQIRGGGRLTSGLCIPLGELESWMVVEESAVASFSSWLLFKQRFPCTHNLGRGPCTSTGGWHATHWWPVSFCLVFLAHSANSVVFMRDMKESYNWIACWKLHFCSQDYRLVENVGLEWLFTGLCRNKNPGLYCSVFSLVLRLGMTLKNKINMFF